MQATYRCAALLTLTIMASAAFPGWAQSRENALHVMPMPRSVRQSEGKFRLSQDFRASFPGYHNTRLQHAAARMLQRMREKTGLPLAAIPLAGAEGRAAALQMDCRGAGESIPSMRMDEAYTLEVTSESMHLSAATPTGIMRGMETFLQLIDLDDQSFFIPSLTIADQPRFCWRGLHIDVARHWMPLDVIRRNLDAMAAMKLNVLHWHLSDDQGFRVESRVHPRLHAIGSEGNYYTQSQIREIVDYARDRGIRIVPEFDMPGHTTAWLAAYPELASAPGPFPIEKGWGVFDPCMDPTRETLYAFLDAFFGEMTQLFPDEYFHIGGDEVNGKQWNANARIQAFKKRRQLKSNRDLQAYFNQRLQKMLRKYGKKVIGWDEIVHADLPQTVTVQSWRSKPSLAEVVNQGYRGILSHGYYLDQMQPAAVHYENDPEGRDPGKLTAEARSRILGGEACMWAEMVNADNIDSRIWPRAAAIAERFWSPAEVRDVPDMYRRLEYASLELERLGLNHRSHYPRMLQSIAGSASTVPLKTLADLLQPVKLGVRVNTRKYYSHSPLNRLADIVPPESAPAREFGILVDQALADPAPPADTLNAMREWLLRWQQHARLADPLMEQSFILKEVLPASAAIAGISALGLQALHYMETGENPPADWESQATMLLEQSAKPQAEMLIAVVPHIRKLVAAAVGRPASLSLRLPDAGR